MRPPARPADGLGLRRAIPDRVLPSVVAAMAFLAALAFAGAVGAHALATRWSQGAGAIVTVQVPDPQAPAATTGATSGATGAGSRIDTVLAALAGTAAIASRHRLDEHELEALLQPWLGARSELLALPLPAVVQVRLRPGAALPATLAGSLDRAAPGTLVEDSADWSRRLLALTYSLQACAGLALLTVAAVAGWVVALATRAGIARRRGAIELVHGLGGTDSYVAGRFARRTGWLALVGGAAGALVALPVLAQLSRLAAPFAAGDLGQAPPGGHAGALTGAVIGSQTGLLPGLLLDALPVPLLVGLPALPLATGLIGWLTAQATVRAWLRRLP